MDRQDIQNAQAIVSTNRNGFWPTGKEVNAGQNVTESMRWWECFTGADFLRHLDCWMISDTSISSMELTLASPRDSPSFCQNNF